MKLNMNWTLIEKWNMNNGTDGFIDFHANHHPACRFTAEELEDILSMSGDFLWLFMANHRWLSEQYRRWFTGTDRFATVAMYYRHRYTVDNTNLFYNWLVSK